MITKSCELTLWQHLSWQGKCFSLSRNLTAINSTDEVDWILIRNPTGSGMTVRLNEVIMGFIPNAANQSSTFRFYRTPTITNVGTLITTYKVKPSSETASRALAYSDPTISNRGTLITLFTVTITNFQREQHLARYVEEGRDMLITVQPGTSGLQHSYVATHAET